MVSRKTIEDLPITDEKWVEVPDFRCRKCKNNAHKHPQSSSIWACKTCQIITESVSVFFEEYEPGNSVAVLSNN